jgi:hypothetical protein
LACYQWSTKTARLGISGDGALKATMGVVFVERDGKNYMIFDALGKDE